MPRLENLLFIHLKEIAFDQCLMPKLLFAICSEKMEALVSDMENVAEKIMQIVRENSERKTMYGGDILQGQDLVGSVCYVCKHRNNRRANYLGYDVIKMLIRGTDYSHALCLHICDGSSEFHVYSKKGWVSFCPDKDALVVTAGDQIQVQIATYTCILNLNSPCFLSK